MNEERQNAHRTIDDYTGPSKWCFAVVLNRACDNYEENHNLFVESLLVFEQKNRKNWFDEEIRERIKQAGEEKETNQNLKPNALANRRLSDVRNYFSHFHHKDFCLIFKKEDSIRIIMEAAYTKAKEHVYGKQTKETDIEIKELFDSHDKITPAGVVFLASFFVERRILARLMGYVTGFKKTKGEYSITHEIFSTYCLKDSYSIHTQNPGAMLFRDIMGYLSRIPSEYYQYYSDQCIKDEEAERKTDKFITFSLIYLELFVFKNIKDYEVRIGHSEIVREEKEKTEGEEEQYKPQPNKGKIKIQYAVNSVALPYYINHNTAALQIRKEGGETYQCKIGVNELKYLVLLCLQKEQSMATEAIGAIYQYLHAMQKPEEIAQQGDHTLFQGLPEFILKQKGLIRNDSENAIQARLKYIREKLDKKKKESAEMQLHRKARDILAYLNQHVSPPLSTDEYNKYLSFLLQKNLDRFDKALAELKRTESITDKEYEKLKGAQKLDILHEKVILLVRAELKHLEENDVQKLAERIGVIRTPDERAPDYDKKLETFTQQPMIYKGFMRDTFFAEKKKTFAKLTEQTLNEWKYPDMPLRKEDKDCYYIPELDRFDKANAILYETLAKDRLCSMMARRCYEQINENLRKHGQTLDWKEENGKEYIYLRFHYDPSDTNQPQRTTSRQTFGEGLNIQIDKNKLHEFTIRFDRKHYTKLYVMDDAHFLGGLMLYFFPEEKTIDYHKLYSDGINHYTELQRQGIKAILLLEEKIIQKKEISTNVRYIPFWHWKSQDTIMGNSGYPDFEQSALRQIRNALLHYHLGVKKKQYGYDGFTQQDFALFAEVMEREGICKKEEWILKIKK